MEAAEKVRRACIDAAVRAYEDAGLRGLCPEGRWEAAVGAMRALDVRALLEPPGSTVDARGPEGSR